MPLRPYSGSRAPTQVGSHCGSGEAGVSKRYHEHDCGRVALTWYLVRDAYFWEVLVGLVRGLPWVHQDVRWRSRCGKRQGPNHREKALQDEINL